MNTKPTSLYVHIPFCKHICSYCDFCKMFYDVERANKYLDALEIEISNYDINYELSTIFIGGGTPTCLNYEQLERLLKIIEPYSHKVDEYTIEINPETMDKDKLLLLRKYNINRLSIGVQTFKEDILLNIGRQHVNSDVFKIINDAYDIGFKNISIDMMYGLPNQSYEDLAEDLRVVSKLDKIAHISYYSLILEDHTVLSALNYQPLDEQIEGEYYELIEQSLNNSGYFKYEVSNFSRPGFESKHNQVYWKNEHYYGIGLGSHGYIDDIRYENTRSYSNYLNGEFLLESTTLSLEDKMFEEIMLGLRLVKGINMLEFYRKYGYKIEDVYERAYKKYLKRGLLIVDNNYLKTSKEGMLLLHEILSEFMN